MLTLDIVREHVKLDGGDQDALLKVYLDAAVSAAERYTGKKFKPGRVTDTYANPVGSSFRLSGEPNGAVVARVYLAGRLQQFIATARAQVAYLPVGLDCGIDRLELDYAVGPTCTDNGAVLQTDPMIELGVLKFVAHALMNRGDDPNCWAADSGAASLWRPFKSISFG